MRPRPIVIALVWSVLVLVSLVLPGSSVPQADLLEYDKVVHALLFGVGVFLWLRVPWSSPSARRVIVLGALLFAPVSELMQAMIGRGRAADPWDAVADVIGVVLGVGAWLFRRHRRNANQSVPPAAGDQTS